MKKLFGVISAALVVFYGNLLLSAAPNQHSDHLGEIAIARCANMLPKVEFDVISEADAYRALTAHLDFNYEHLSNRKRKKQILQNASSIIGAQNSSSTRKFNMQEKLRKKLAEQKAQNS